MNSYNKEAIFHLPGMFQHSNLYYQLLFLWTENKYYFKDNIKIGSIYGCPKALWNGGRLALVPSYDRVPLINLKDTMIKYNIPVRFTFTNCMLEKHHLGDTYCNMLLEIFNTGTNEIICNSPILEEYIRLQYKDRYKYISSTTKRLNNITTQDEELEKDYYLVVLDYDFNKNFEYLQSIKNKSKCEILCNPVCIDKCPLRKKHYETISKAQLLSDGSEAMQCPYQTKDTLWSAMQKNNFISVEDINNIYLPMGFNNFKLEGRATHPLELIEILLYYLVKDEYQREVRTILQNVVW